jgi:IS30 family transposase
MDETFQAILDSLPPKPARSRLEPYAELIHELRRRGRSYREITALLADRCGVRVGVHTLYNFVRVRTQASKKARKARNVGSASDTPSPRAAAPTAGSEHGEQNKEVWQRIQVLKERPAARTNSAEKVFHYDEDAPLTVNRKKDPI